MKNPNLDEDSSLQVNLEELIEQQKPKGTVEHFVVDQIRSPSPAASATHARILAYGIAAVALALFLGVYSRYWGQDSPALHQVMSDGTIAINQKPMSTQGLSVQLARGDQLFSNNAVFQMRLSSKQFLDIDQQTLLVYEDHQRIKIDQGRVHFLSDDANAHWTFSTPHGNVATIGTEFDLLVDENEIRMVVMDGAIRFENANTETIVYSQNSIIANSLNAAVEPQRARLEPWWISRPWLEAIPIR